MSELRAGASAWSPEPAPPADDGARLAALLSAGLPPAELAARLASEGLQSAAYALLGMAPPEAGGDAGDAAGDAADAELEEALQKQEIESFLDAQGLAPGECGGRTPLPRSPVRAPRTLQRLRRAPFPSSLRLRRAQRGRARAAAAAARRRGRRRR